MATPEEETSLWGSLESFMGSGAKALVKADAIATRVNQFGMSDAERTSEALRTQSMQRLYQEQINNLNGTGSTGFNSSTLLIGGGLLLAFMLLG